MSNRTFVSASVILAGLLATGIGTHITPPSLARRVPCPPADDGRKGAVAGGSPDAFPWEDRFPCGGKPQVIESTYENRTFSRFP